MNVIYDQSPAPAEILVTDHVADMILSEHALDMRFLMSLALIDLTRQGTTFDLSDTLILASPNYLNP